MFRVLLLFAMMAAGAILSATSPSYAADQKAERCRDERRKPGQSQEPPTEPIFIQNEVAVPVFYRVRIWTQDEMKVNAGKCVRVPFPKGFERLRSINVEVYVKGDRSDKCNINATIGYEVVVQGAQERIACRMVKHKE